MGNIPPVINKQSVQVRRDKNLLKPLILIEINILREQFVHA